MFLILCLHKTYLWWSLIQLVSLAIYWWTVDRLPRAMYNAKTTTVLSILSTILSFTNCVLGKEVLEMDFREQERNPTKASEVMCMTLAVLCLEKCDLPLFHSSTYSDNSICPLLLRHAYSCRLSVLLLVNVTEHIEEFAIIWHVMSWSVPDAASVVVHYDLCCRCCRIQTSVESGLFYRDKRKVDGEQLWSIDWREFRGDRWLEQIFKTLCR